jgi:hypothetical protein
VIGVATGGAVGSKPQREEEFESRWEAAPAVLAVLLLQLDSPSSAGPSIGDCGS